MRNPAHPGIAIVTLLNIEPHADTLILRQIVDCNEKRRAVLNQMPDFDAGNLPTDIDWQTGGEPAYLFKAVCSNPK